MGMLSSYLCIHVALGKREEPYSVDLMSPVSRGPQTRFKNYYDLVHRSILKLRQSMGDYETGQKFMTAIIHAAKLEKTPVIETKALVNRHKAMWIPRESGVSMQWRRGRTEDGKKAYILL